MPNAHSAHVSFFAPAVLRRFFLAFFLSVVVSLVIVAAIYRQDVIHQRVLLEQESNHVLELQMELVLFEFRSVQSDLLYLATQEALKKALSGDAAARRNLEREYVSFALNKAVYDQIRYLDLTGQEVVRVNYSHEDATAVSQSDLQSKAARYYFQQALSLGEGNVFVSPFDLNVEHGQIEQPVKPVIRFLAPVFDNSGRKRGFLVLNYLGAHLLSQLRQISSGFRGETMLVNSAGEYLQASSPSHEWGWLLNHKHSFLTDFSASWERGKRSEASQFRVGEELFTFRRVSPGSRSAAEQAGPPDVENQITSSLFLVSYVTSAVANAHSSELLNQLLLLHVGVMAIIVLLSFYWARSGEVRRYHEQRIAESEHRLRQLSSCLLAAQETERRSLSRDLHDELGQQVTAISLDLQSLAKKEGGIHSIPLLRRAIEETDELLRSLHEIAARVRPSVLDDLGLPDAVESFISSYQRRTGVDVKAKLCLVDTTISPTIGENVFRVLQEALANVAAHAGVNSVEVAIETDNEMLHMTVLDSGVGFEPNEVKESTRLGILGMRERVELLHGEFHLESTPGGGTQIRVAIPLRTVRPLT